MKRTNLTSKDISVVIQGNPCGTRESPALYTRKLSESIRKHLPEAEIIVSTWEDQNVEGIHWDKLQLSRPVPMTYVIRPDEKLYPQTVNHQLITSRSGIQAASRKYVLKIRSDMILENDRILKMWNHYAETPRIEGIQSCISRERIMVLPTYNHRRGMCFPYNVCDWLFFGSKEDILDLFHIPLMDLDALCVRNGEKYPRVEDNMGAEQYIWIEYMKQKHVNSNLKGAMDTDEKELMLFEETIAQNLIMASARKLGVNSQKMPGSGYASKPCLSQGLYTFSEWKRLCNQYAGSKFKLCWNPIEDAVYVLALKLREKIRGGNVKLYGFIIMSVRKVRAKHGA